jgi:Uma2 family endonuclease
MATIPRPSTRGGLDYPTSDGKPMAESDVHRKNMVDLIETLEDHFAHDPNVYVSGNLLVFYEPGNKRKHVAPDVFLVRGVPKLPPRGNYLVWEEGKGPDLVIELTSRTTQRDDRQKKFELYRDTLKVSEYFLFDPNADWLKPPLQGFRLSGAEYIPIERVGGHFLPSDVLGLHLVRHGFELRLYDPSTSFVLPTRSERLAQSMSRQADSETRLGLTARSPADTKLELAEARLDKLEAENEQLRREVEALRRQLTGET